eukprot:Gregarina_sp_Poly_1__4523@NODE_242_length_10830_cov_108_673047_g213_i0_p6_GENE_NODE_242_length_10830_cov_108_673047_g213_i0NODE_242_length_10830_cov_108_673047_g213_i0_p6_ORF_typecomplete_len201_score29_56Choline_transpo/PF04515_12/0_78_NODE_242_length_10830_cov_108_673047_g213_i020692671
MFSPPPSDMRSLWFLPLALTGCIIAVSLLLHNTFQIVSILYIERSSTGENDDGSIEFGDWLTVAVHSIQMSLTLLGILSIVFKKSRGVSLLVSGFHILHTTILMQTSASWISWTLAKIGIHEGQDLTRFEIFHRSMTSLFALVLLFTSYWTFGALSSLMHVINAGGTGWEYLNASQVKERCFERFLMMAGRQSSMADNNP